MMRKIFFTILLIIGVSTNAIAQSLYVGETKYLSTPSNIPYDGYVTHAWWSCTNPNIHFSEADEVGAIIEPTHYFAGTATIECTYAYSYWGWDDRIHVGHGTTYFYISCKPVNASISETNINMNIGDTYRLSYTLDKYSYSKASAEWSSSNESVVKVDSKGKVTAIGSGNARIKLDPIVGPSVYCDVKVAYIAPKGIIIKESNVSVVEGKSKTLTYELSPKGASSNVIWLSSNENVLKVSSSGRISGISEGTAKITVKTENNLSASCNVRVIPAPRSVTLPKNKNIIQGYTTQLIPEVAPIETETTYKWKSSDTSIATVTKEGMVTAIKTGTTVITVTTDNGLSASCNVVVIEGSTSTNSRDVRRRLGIVKSLMKETLKYIKK